MTSSHLGSLFQSDPSEPPRWTIRQGTVQAWNTDTGENTIELAGGALVNIPSLTAEAAELVVGDVVAVATTGDQALVLGKVTTPGNPGTVPTWNADIQALAPLADLAAVTTGTTITGATQESSGAGPRVVINDPTYPGEVVLYTGAVDEEEPARLKPIVSGSSYLQLIGPKITGGGAPATLHLWGASSGSGMDLDADDQHMFATDMTIDGFTRIRLGDGTDYLTIVGQVVTDADLSSSTNIFPTNPYYYGYLSASVAITTSGTPQKITTWVDDGSPNSSDIADPSSGNFTIPRTGRYRLRAQGWWAAVASPVGVRTVQWVRVSPNTILCSHTVPGNSATSPMPVLTEKTVRLTSGEQIFVQVIQSQANGHQLIGSNPDITYAQIEWVGP